MMDGWNTSFSHSCWDQNDGHDEAIECDSLGEDHEQNDGDKDVVVLDSLDTCLARHTDSQTRGESRQTDAQSATQVLPPVEVSVLPIRRITQLIQGCLLD